MTAADVEREQSKDEKERSNQNEFKFAKKMLKVDTYIKDDFFWFTISKEQARVQFFNQGLAQC